MRITPILSLALAGALLACSSPSGPPADRFVYQTSEAPMASLDTMSEAQRTQQPVVPPANDMTEGERIAWFQSHGTWPHPYYPGPGEQSLGYVPPTTSAWDYIWPALLIGGAAWGLYEIKRHND